MGKNNCWFACVGRWEVRGHVTQNTRRSCISSCRYARMLVIGSRAVSRLSLMETRSGNFPLRGKPLVLCLCKHSRRVGQYCTGRGEALRHVAQPRSFLNPTSWLVGIRKPSPDHFQFNISFPHNASSKQRCCELVAKVRVQAPRSYKATNALDYLETWTGRLSRSLRP